MLVTGILCPMSSHHILRNYSMFMNTPGFKNNVHSMILWKNSKISSLYAPSTLASLNTQLKMESLGRFCIAKCHESTQMMTLLLKNYVKCLKYLWRCQHFPLKISLRNFFSFLLISLGKNTQSFINEI